MKKTKKSNEKTTTSKSDELIIFKYYMKMNPPTLTTFTSKWQEIEKTDGRTLL